MHTQQPAITKNVSQSEIDLIVTSIQKLDKFFSDEQNAKKFLQPTGWLNVEGSQRLQARWTPYSLCFTILKTSIATLPKTNDVAKLINDRTHVFGCTVMLRETKLGVFFVIEGLNFFWFGE